MKEKLGVATKVEKEHDALEKYYNDVKVATEQVYDNNYVTTQRIKIINSTVPKDLVFTQISIDNKTLTIKADYFVITAAQQYRDNKIIST